MCPYEFGASDEQRAQLEQLGALLAGCRDVFIAAFEDGMLNERADSQAEHDFALRPSGPEGPWPGDVNIQPRALAAKLVREQVDFAVTVGIAICAGEVFRPMSSLVRSIVEYGTRATWVIDPSANTPDDPERGHRVRSIRTMLTELVSVHHLREALSKRDDVDEGVRRRMKQAWKHLMKLARSMFHDVMIDGDPSRWSIEGIRHQSWTTIAETWADLEESGVHGGAVYQLLAVESHPQGFFATQGFRLGDNGAEFAVTTDDVVNRVQLAVVSTYSAVTLLANYHRYTSQLITEWENAIKAVLPDVFRS